MYETIEEEPSAYNLSSPSSPARLGVIASSPSTSMLNDEVVIVVPESPSHRASDSWDDTHKLTMQKFYALKHQAEQALEESKRAWSDTPISTFAVQSKHAIITPT